MQLTVYNKNQGRIKWICIIFFLLITLMQIFSISNFSAQNSKASTKASDVVVDKLEFVPESIPRKSEVEGELTLTYIVRKVAHFCNFALLGILLCIDKHLTKNGIWQSIIWAAIGLFVAAFDEFHQYFVPGRSAEVTDAMIDFSGVLFGLCVVELVLRLIVKRRHNEKEKSGFKQWRKCS